MEIIVTGLVDDPHDACRCAASVGEPLVDFAWLEVVSAPKADV